MVSDATRRKQLRRIWNEVMTDDPRLSENEARILTLEIYNNSYMDHALNSDLTEALETMGEYR